MNTKRKLVLLRASFSVLMCIISVILSSCSQENKTMLYNVVTKEELRNIIGYGFLDISECEVIYTNDNDAAYIFLIVDPDRIEQQTHDLFDSYLFHPCNDFNICAPYQLRELLAEHSITNDSVIQCGYYFREISYETKELVNNENVTVLYNTGLPVYWYVLGNDEPRKETLVLMTCIQMKPTDSDDYFLSIRAAN